jgi:hypothetical protein
LFAHVVVVVVVVSASNPPFTSSDVVVVSVVTLGGLAKTAGTSEGAAKSASARVAARIEKTIFVLIIVSTYAIYKRISG